VRVAIETQFAVGSPTGLGVYAAHLASALRARGEVEVVEMCDRSIDVWRFDRRVRWDQLRAPRIARMSRADVVHFTGGTLPWRLPHPVVLTLHDVAFVRGEHRGRFYVRWYFGRLQLRLARRADALVVDSLAARADVARCLGIDAARIDVAGAGVDERFFSLARRPSDPPFILCVGTVEARKDLLTAVSAIARIPGVRLVSAGPLTTYADDVRREADRLGVADRIELLGYVDEARLMDLYSRAALLAFPSRYEGFGLPPLQALACGLPVAAASIATSEEVLADCAWFAPPGDAAGFARLFEEILSGGPAVAARVERGKARAATFTWDAVAQRMTAIYRRVADRWRA
jgi:glycosyltransferase involved in cell wall biosynthesis